MKKRFSKRFLVSSLRAALVSSVAVLSVAAFTGLTTEAHTVVIHDEDAVYSVMTTSVHPAEILQKQGITLGENDYYDLTGLEKDEADLYIVRPHEVLFVNGKEKKTVLTTAKTVQDLLDEQGIVLDENMVVNQALTDPLENGKMVAVSYFTYNEYTKTSVIPFETIYEGVEPSDTTIEEVKVKGEEGKKQTSYRETYLNGTLLTTETTAENVVAEPVNEVIVVKEATTQVAIGGVLQYFAPGTAPIELDENGIPVNYAYKVTGKATAYSNFGKPCALKPGDVAMDLSRFPRGTHVYIVTTDGTYAYGYSRVSDTGTALVDGRVLVDCFFYTYEESCRFGAKTVDVYVLND